MDTPSFQEPQREPKKEKIHFRPITSGLGFHADTRPYAPAIKRPIHTASIPTPNRSTSPEVALLRSALAIRTTSVLPQAPKPQSVLAEKSFAEPHYSFLYSLKRVVAFGLDCVFNLSLFIGAVSVVLWRIDLSPSVLFSRDLALITSLFLFTFTWALTAAQEIAFGTSLGKRSLGLTLQGGAAALFLRSFFFTFSLIFFGLGILWAIFDSKRRCWHDLFVNVQPTEIAKL